jgi:ubiquitin-like protein ATG12
MPSPRLPFRPAPTDAAPIPDEEEHEADLPLTMTASAVLTSLPRDAHAALAAAGAFEKEKSTFARPPSRPSPTSHRLAIAPSFRHLC